MVRLASIFFGAATLVAGQKFTLDYYDDGNCTVALNKTVFGPTSACINLTASGGDFPISGLAKTAQVANCYENSNYTLSIMTTATSCPTTGMTAFPVMTTGCTFSSTFGKYYLATCSNSVAYSGNSAAWTITTTTTTPLPGQRFTLDYFDDANCTVALNKSVAGPQDACINLTASGGDFPISGLAKTASATSCHEASNYTLSIMTTATSCPTTGMTAFPVFTSGCSFSSTFGKYYLATCSNSLGYTGNAAAFTITTTTTTPVPGQKFTLDYYDDANCTVALNKTVTGPQDACINLTASGGDFPISGLAKTAQVANCHEASNYTLSIMTTATSCPTTGMTSFPVMTTGCTFSSTFGKYYLATCSNSHGFVGNAASFTITTTHAPIDQGTFHIKYYSDAACTTPHLMNGLNTEIGGPMGGCVNTSLTVDPVSALQAFYKVIKVDQCNGAQYTMRVNTAYDCSVGTDFPVTVGPCHWSTTVQAYYLAACNSTTWSGASLTFTTTLAPVVGKAFTLDYFDDANCTVALNKTVFGPQDICVNLTASGGDFPVSGMAKTASVSNCHEGANYTLAIMTTSESCPTTGMTAFPVLTSGCTFSSTFGKYYLATCSNTNGYRGDAAPFTITTTTTTAAPTTTVAANTTVAPANEGGADSTSDTAATTAAPKIQASYEATEDLPASTTAADLMASTTYTNAKKTGIAQALSVAASKVTIDGFAITGRRLANKGRRLASKTVVTEYTVEVTAATLAAKQTLIESPAIAATIQTETTTAMAAADWSGESVLTAAPTITVTSSTFVGTVAPAATPTSTSFAMNLGSLSMLAAAVAAMFMLS